MGHPSSAGILEALLGDSSKLAQRAAAWSLRQIYSRHEDAAGAPLLTALSSPDARVRWGATRVFAHHFAALARRGEMMAALENVASDPVIPVRMDAIKALWQGWFWNADPAVRSRIEDIVLAGMAERQHPWVGQNLSDALYNLADENIRYLYNNWVTLMGSEQDRERAIGGRLSVETQLADKIAGVLDKGSDLQKKKVLGALAEPPLRRGDVYDLGADLSKNGPLVYSRIGNDIEQIAFFGPSADKLAKSLLPLLSSSDPEMRRLAERASPIVRETNFAATNRLAGDRGTNLELIFKELKSRPDAADVVAAMRPPAAGPVRPAAAATARTDAARQKKLDEPFFHAYVEPILNKKGKDGYACANCHITHTLFNATWSKVMNVVDTATPENSLILRKPTSTADSEGVVGSGQLAHGGGVRWPKGSIEYETILQWIQGAKLDSTAGH